MCLRGYCPSYNFALSIVVYSTSLLLFLVPSPLKTAVQHPSVRASRGYPDIRFQSNFFKDLPPPQNTHNFPPSSKSQNRIQQNITTQIPADCDARCRPIHTMDEEVNTEQILLAPSQQHKSIAISCPGWHGWTKTRTPFPAHRTISRDGISGMRTGCALVNSSPPTCEIYRHWAPIHVW